LTGSAGSLQEGFHQADIVWQNIDDKGIQSDLVGDIPDDFRRQITAIPSSIMSKWVN
jgi:hypothetical protein